MKEIKLYALLILVISSTISFAQPGSGSKVTDETKDPYDTLKKSSEYPYKLPFLGKKVAKKGFKIPYPVGVMLNTVAVVQDVEISDLKVGFNDGEMYNLDSIVSFGTCKAHIQNINARVDFWLLPFFNVYGMFGTTWVQTDVNLVTPIQASTQAKFFGYLYGVGAMLATGVNNWFFSLDYNSTWSDFKQIKGTVNAQMLSLRIGYSVPIKKESNLSVWIGASTVFLNRMTEGSISLGDIAPDFQGSKLLAIINSSKADYPDMTVAKYEVMKTVAQEMYDHLADINTQVDNTTVNYSLKKRPTHNFTGIFGVQYQLNKHWQFRGEIATFGGRNSALLSANYRFGF